MYRKKPKAGSEFEELRVPQNLSHLALPDPKYTWLTWLPGNLLALTRPGLSFVAGPLSGAQEASAARKVITVATPRVRSCGPRGVRELAQGALLRTRHEMGKSFYISEAQCLCLREDGWNQLPQAPWSADAGLTGRECQESPWPTIKWSAKGKVPWYRYHRWSPECPSWSHLASTNFPRAGVMAHH